MAEIRNVVILGSTGSIGVQTLDVIRQMPAHLRVVGLAAHSNVDLLANQIAEFRPEIAVLTDVHAAAQLRDQTRGKDIRIVEGNEGLEEVATFESADIIVGAMLGFAGLRPTLAAIRAGKTIALANKETLVAAGELVMAEAMQRNVKILPVDSEHSALFQCLEGEDMSSVRRLILTASGGPFVDRSEKELRYVRREQALAHPTWRMGEKITIDSATLMNKGLEVIEARWLFNTEVDRIDVVIHRQSIIHSLVEFCDGSVKAQLGIPDMRLPIQFALLYPTRTHGPAPRLELTSLSTLTFERPDYKRFACLQLAQDAGRRGGTAPAVLNAANEVAVDAFLKGKLDFLRIPHTIERVLEQHDAMPCDSLDNVLNADDWARRSAREMLAVTDVAHGSG